MSKVFVCISGISLEECKKQAAGKYSSELRLDLTPISPLEISQLWKSSEEWILTLREEFTSRSNWQNIFKYCLNLNPKYVDIDSELPESIKKEAIKWVRNTKSDLILSFHNFDLTPELETLNAKAKSLYLQGADVVKIVCMANKEEDNLVVMDLFREHDRIISFCMGELGRESRVTSLFFGEKMTYAAPSEEELVAPGQLTYGELSDMLNLGFDDE